MFVKKLVNDNYSVKHSNFPMNFVKIPQMKKQLVYWKNNFMHEKNVINEKVMSF